jgi:formylglycine-generating enzyme required for sulfatase activity
MKRLIQHAMIAMLLAGGVVLLFLNQLAPADTFKTDDLPKVEPLKHKGYSETIPGSEVKFDMVPIPGGVYMMGSPADEKGRSKDEGPQHPVKIRPFWMGKCEVSWDEYDLWREDKDAVIGEGKRRPKKLKDEKIPADAITRPTPPYADPTFGLGSEGFPAICMTQHAAMEYCRWLSHKTKKVYRLPTEAEWEWAARAGSKTTYFFGDDPAKLGDYAWYAENSEEVTHEVGKKKPNPWGLHDILGNVSEWCLDHYDANYYAKFPVDKLSLCPVLLPSDKRFPHTVRGGSWKEKAERARCAARRESKLEWMKQDPNRPRSIWWLTDAQFVGFRVVRAVEEQDNLKNLRSKVTRQSD